MEWYRPGVTCNMALEQYHWWIYEIMNTSHWLYSIETLKSRIDQCNVSLTGKVLSDHRGDICTKCRCIFVIFHDKDGCPFFRLLVAQCHLQTLCWTWTDLLHQQKHDPNVGTMQPYRLWWCMISSRLGLSIRLSRMFMQRVTLEPKPTKKFCSQIRRIKHHCVFWTTEEQSATPGIYELH